MSFWRRREVVVHTPLKPETPADLYVKILELEPLSERAWAFASTLGDHDDKNQALQYSKKLAVDPEPYLRWAGAIALVSLHRAGLRDAERALWTLIQDPIATVRAKIAKELSWDTLPETAPLKQALAKDSASDVRLQAAAGLYAFPDMASRSALKTLTHDRDGRVRAEAIRSLQFIETDPPDVREFITFTDDSSPAVRAEMASWLETAEAEYALPHLLHLVTDGDARVRGRAVQSLSGFQNPKAVEAISKTTTDPDGWIRAMSLRILSGFNGEDVMGLLLAHVQDPVPEVRKVVAQQLETRISPELLPVFEKLSEDDGNVNTRRSALRSLEKISGAEAELLITRMLRDPSLIVSKAAKKALLARAKKEHIAPDTAYELQYGRELSTGTKLAFHGRSSVPLKAWEKFLSEVQRLDGRVAASSENTPYVQIDTINGASHCLLPFGPAHWIRLDCLPSGMGYAILSRTQVDNWSMGIQVKHFAHGHALCSRLGWFGGPPASGSDLVSEDKPKQRRGRSRKP